MSTLKCTIEAGCHTSGESFREWATKPDKSLRFRGSLPVQTEYVPPHYDKSQTEHPWPFHPPTANSQGMVAASLSMRLKLTGWNRSRSRLAKIECGLIVVRDHDLPHFLNVFATRIETLYHAELLKRCHAKL